MDDFNLCESNGLTLNLQHGLTMSLQQFRNEPPKVSQWPFNAFYKWPLTILLWASNSFPMNLQRVSISLQQIPGEPPTVLQLASNGVKPISSGLWISLSLLRVYKCYKLKLTLGIIK